MRDKMTVSDGQADGSRETEPHKIGQLKPLRETKTETLHKLLSRPNWATVAQIQKRLICQPHTVRAAILRLRIAGATIELDQSGGAARYRALPMDEAQ